MRYADLIRVAESTHTTPDPDLQREQQALERLRELNRERVARMAVAAQCELSLYLSGTDIERMKLADTLNR